MAISGLLIKSREQVALISLKQACLCCFAQVLFKHQKVGLVTL